MARAPDWDDLFMSAALEPERWLPALGMLASHTGSAHGQLIGVGGARDIPFNLVSGVEPRVLETFVEIGGGSPALNFRVAASVAAVSQGHYDSVLHEDHYEAVKPGLASDRYVRWCEEVDIPFGCQSNLVVDRVGLIGFAILRHRKEGRTTPDQRRTFARASLAARRAVRLQERIEGEQARLLAGAFEAISATAFILDARGQVLAMTAAAEALATAGDVTLRAGQLDAPGLPLSLGQAVAALIADGGLDHVRLRIDAAARPLFLEGFRLPERPWSLGRLPHAILLANQPQRDRAGIAGFLGVLYRLTPAEADIAMRLYDGVTRADIAAARAVSQETLRGQVKAICAKTGSANEAELMRRLAAIMA